MADIKRIKIEAVGLKNIKKELDDIKASMKDATDPSEMARLTAEAVKLESTLDEVNDKVKEFGAESTDSLNGAGKSFSDLKSAISDLDFNKVQSQVDGFAKASANITFSGAIKSLKSLGSTFLTLGKALLTNPIFLLAAVIVGIVVAVYKLLDSLGIIQMAIEALMKPIQYLIDLFYKLTDAMGLTNIAAQKAADEKAQAYEDSAQRIESANNKIVASLDHEIRMAKLNGEDTVELERRKVKAIEETALARLRADAAAWQAGKLNKDLSEEEVKALEDRARASQAAYFQMRNDVEYFEATVLKTEQDNYNKRLSEAKSFEEKKKVAREKEAADRLAAARLEEDLNLQLMEEGDAKLLEQNRLYYERLIEDTESSEALTAEEKIRVVEQYEKLAADKAAEIQKATRDKTKAAEVQAQEELNAILYDLKTSDEQRALDEIDLYYEENINLLREHLEKGLITRAEFDEAEKLLAQEKADKLEEIEEELAQKKKDLEDEVAEKRRQNVADGLAIASQGISAIADLMQASSDAEIAAAEGNEAKQEQLRKKAFEQQKKMQIASAFINMAQGIVAGLGAPFPMNIAMPIIAGVTGLANIAKIKSTQYSGGGGSASGGGAAAPTMPSVNAPSRQAPIVNFQGTGNNNNEVSAGGGNSNITIENRVSVSETEITDKQRTVHNLTNQSQL